MAPTEVPLNATLASITTEATTILSNLTTTLLDTIVTGASQNASSTLLPPNSTDVLKLPEDDDDIHKNPELKYFSTVIIIFLGLTILIVPVFCFVGVICARARVFTICREVAGRGWGFRDLDVPYAEFGSEDYAKDTSKPDSVPVRSNCDVKVLVADDNRVPSSRSHRSNSFLKVSPDEDEDISSLPPTFVHSNA